jgi:hypothetical protein
VSRNPAPAYRGKEVEGREREKKPAATTTLFIIIIQRTREMGEEEGKKQGKNMRR